MTKNEIVEDDGKVKSLKKTWWRWVMLVMCCFFLLGSYFCYDIPGVLEVQIEEQFIVSPTQWSLLYTVYSMPNMILPFFGGLLLDLIGYEVGLIVFTTVLTIG